MFKICPKFVEKIYTGEIKSGIKRNKKGKLTIKADALGVRTVLDKGSPTGRSIVFTLMQKNEKVGDLSLDFRYDQSTFLTGVKIILGVEVAEC